MISPLSTASALNLNVGKEDVVVKKYIGVVWNCASLRKTLCSAEWGSYPCPPVLGCFISWTAVGSDEIPFRFIDEIARCDVQPFKQIFPRFQSPQI